MIRVNSQKTSFPKKDEKYKGPPGMGIRKEAQILSCSEESSFDDIRNQFSN
jgi:hypothetical protein